jgi:hypothetical protein
MWFFWWFFCQFFQGDLPQQSLAVSAKSIPIVCLRSKASKTKINSNPQMSLFTNVWTRSYDFVIYYYSASFVVTGWGEFFKGWLGRNFDPWRIICLSANSS